MKIKILLLLLTLPAIGGAVYLGTYFANHPSGSSPTDTIEKLKEAVMPQSQITSSMFSGKLKLLSTDLGLYDFSTYGDGSEKPLTKYYSAGTYISGKFKGYTRIVGVHEAIGPGGPITNVFATKDNKTYVVDGVEANATKYPIDDYRNPFNGLNKTKVTGVIKLDTLHPETIPLDTNFVLFNKGITSGMEDSGKKSAQGYAIWEPQVVTDFSEDTPLKLDNSELKLYATMPYTNPNASSYTGKEKTLEEIRATYNNGYTQVFALDPTGLPVSYILATTANLKKYQAELATKEYPSLPNLRFLGSQVATNQSLYVNYDVAFPGACGGSYDTEVIKNVPDSDLTKVGTVNGIEVFKLTNKAHPLYTLAYNRKVDLYEDAFKFGNPGKTKPTLDQYVAKNPLLFMKDPWKRLVAIGEYDYMLPGGCGKPVVYLYPTKPTEVTVKFTTDVALTTQIPTYHDGWKVWATPEGVLTDLQPQFTDCLAIDSTHTGSEYAKEACAKATYPYLYWSGNTKNAYPKLTGGWVVKNNQLAGFLDAKLTEVGLNTKEKADMQAFWLPKMLNENAPYYRVSFLQTSEMNALAPMAISPKPDTVFRIFLDYQALSFLPKVSPEPQQLKPLVRQGFTVVEWGGLVK